MQTMTILLGLPGAGKSTYARRAFAPEANRERLIISMDAVRKAYGYTFNPALELDVLYLTVAMARNALGRGHDVVIDESVTTLTLATALVAAARMHGAKVIMHELTTPAPICWKRRKRSGFPRRQFDGKALEWCCNRFSILALADEYRAVSPWA